MNRSRNSARLLARNSPARRRFSMTIVERELELVPDGSRIGLGSGRAAQAFVKALGVRIRRGRLCVHDVPTPEETANLARQEGIPLLTLAEAGILDLTVDGADEEDPKLISDRPET
jgi:ribose 5-phosphate isomerase A